MAGQTAQRRGGGSGTYLVTNVKNMSPTSQGLSVRILATAADLRAHVKERGALTVLYLILWIDSRRRSPETSKEPPYAELEDEIRYRQSSTW